MHQWSAGCWLFSWILDISVADPERFDADPDPTFQADADPNPFTMVRNLFLQIFN